MPGPVVVFDTNVLIPLLLPASHSTRLLERLDRAGWRVALSPQILADVSDKLRHKSALRRWLELSDDEINQFVAQDLPAKTLAIPGRREAHGSCPADPKDDKIIAAALEAKATHIVTEDKHLPDLLVIGHRQLVRHALGQLRDGQPPPSHFLRAQPLSRPRVGRSTTCR